MDFLLTPAFWVAVGQIILIDILLGGDNAVVIALACRKLPDNLRTKGILWGTAGAIVLRVILIFFALTLLAIPFLKIVGAILLFWIGIKLLVPEDDEAHGNIQASDKLWAAVKTIIIADLVMSIDNVIAIAGAAQGAGQAHQMPLVIFGLLVSIPIIVWGSQLVIKLMDRFPIIITAGGMLLGWIAGTMAVSDPAVARPDAWTWVPKLPQTDIVKYGAGIAGALLVLAWGKWAGARRRPHSAPAAPHGALESAEATALAAPSGAISRVLIAVDASDAAARAVERAIALRGELRSGKLEVHLVHVQRALPGDVTRFVAQENVTGYFKDKFDEATARARSLLDAAGQPYKSHSEVGVPGERIAEVAANEGCNLIVMGSRGLGSHTAAMVGSVAQSTLAHSQVPVLLVQ